MKRHHKRSATPKNLRAIQTSRHLHVAAHRHTGHVLPRHTTSYPTLIMIVLCAGVLMFNWTRFVTADQSYNVHASVPGPPPSVPATIDTPLASVSFTSAPVTITGTCPLNSYVGLTRNSFASGVALCDATGHYQLLSDLFKGTNQLVIYDYSLTDAQGPASSTVTVYYAPSARPASSPASSGSTGGSGGSAASQTRHSIPYNPSSPAASGLPEPLLLKSNFTFLGYYIGQPAAWKVDIEGGTPPYALDAEWGDGQQQLYSEAQAGTVSLQHVYSKTGGYHGSYVVKITATDAQGNQTFLQLIAIVSPRPKAVAAGAGGGQNLSASSDTGLFGSTNVGHMVDYAWSGYGVVLLMLSSFWLGERRELRLVHFRPKRTRHA